MDENKDVDKLLQNKVPADCDDFAKAFAAAKDNNTLK